MKVIFLFYYLIVQTTIICAFNQYLGCFIDQIGDRDLEVFIDDHEQMTPKQCIIACREQNFLYAAIQYGNECRCSQKYGKYGQASNDECDYLCSTSEKCGGDSRNSVYSVVNSKDSGSTDVTCQNNLIGYQGCFNDVTLQIVMGEVNSIEECIKRCSGNYNYAGIMNGHLCYCGNDLNQPSSNSNLCNIPCDINSNDMTLICCGGPRVLSVYNVKNYQSPLTIDLSETYIRVGNDTTFMSSGTASHTTVGSSTSTVITSTFSYTVTAAAKSLQSSIIPTSIPISSNAFTTTTISTLLSSPMTSAQLLTTGLLSTALPSSTSPSITLSSTHSSLIASFTSSSVSGTSSLPHSSLITSSMMSNTPISLTSTVGTLITTILSTSIAPTSTGHSTLLVVTTISTNTNSISFSQSFTNLITATMSSPSSSSISTNIISTTLSSLAASAGTSSSLHTETNPTTGNTITNIATTLSTSLMTFTSQSSSHTDTSQGTGMITASSSSSSHTDTSQGTSMSIASSAHTDTSQGTSMVTASSSSSSSSHTDTSQGTNMVTASSSSHTDTSQGTNMVTTSSSSHTDTSQRTSMGITSSSHTDTTNPTSSILPSSSITANIASTTLTSISAGTGQSITSSHTDTTNPTSSILLSSSVLSNTASVTLTSILTGTGQSATSSHITGSNSHSDIQSSTSIPAGPSVSTGTSLPSTLISLLTSPQTVSTASSPFTPTYISQTLTIPISSTLISSSNSLIPSISSTFSTIITTGSYNPSFIISTLSSQLTSTVSQQSSMGLTITSSSAPSTQSASSVTSTSFLSTNLFTSRSTSVGAQSTVTTNTFPFNTANQTTVSIQSSTPGPIISTNISPITTTNSNSQTSVMINTINGSITTNTIATTTTTPLAAYVISTVLVTSSNQTLDPTNSVTRESIRQKLIQIITLAFYCVYNPSNTNCTAARQRVKRQACSLGYNVILVSDITEVANTNPKQYTVNYIVTNPCSSGAPISPVQIKAATDTLLRGIITSILGYAYSGDLIKSTSIITSTDAPVTDRKLWLIGAVLGPVAFVLLLICLFCYLHFKCRPRPTNRRLVQTVYNEPQLLAKATNYQTVPNETVKERASSEKTLHIITQNDPLVGGTNISSQHLTPIALQKNSTNPSQYPISNDIPMEEIRRQNDVERWRNKLRLQEKFQQPSIGHQDLSAPNTNRSIPSQYDNRAFEHDPSRINIQPIDEIISVHSPRRMPQITEIETGRTKLHRLLDDVLDKAESEDSYNPDSEIERQKRRRQRRRVHSISDDHQNSPTISNRPQIPHTPVIPQVSERPDPSLIRLRYNPYEAGDHAHDIARFTPVELRRKYATDDNNIEQRSTQFSSRSNPPLFYDDSIIADRAATGTDAYGNPKRLAQTRVETDREAMMRHDGGRIDRRQHRFNDDAVYIDTIPKNRDGDRIQTRTAWAEPSIHNDVLKPNDYRDEYLIAKRSVLNTRNIISSIHGELQNISFPSSDSYHA